MENRYRVALLIVAALSIGAFGMLNIAISSQASDAALVNISGRQRMLTQQVALFAQIAVNESRLTRRDMAREQLRRTLDELERSHRFFIEGGSKGGLSIPKSEILKNQYVKTGGVDERMRSFLDLGRHVVTNPSSASASLEVLLSEATGPLLSLLDAVVRQFEMEAQRRVERLARWQVGILVITLLSLVMMAALIFQPIVKRYREQARRLAGSRRSLESAYLVSQESRDALRRSNKDLNDMVKTKERLAVDLSAASHRAGMAEVATGVLHNVGNALNSIRVAAAAGVERLANGDRNKLTNALIEIAELDWDTDREKAEKLLRFATLCSERLKGRGNAFAEELQIILSGSDHIGAIVRSQQRYAKLGRTDTAFDLVELVRDAEKMALSDDHGVVVSYDQPRRCEVSTDRHSVLQVLVNFIGNAKDAVLGNPEDDRKLTISIAKTDDEVAISVTDNGAGIDSTAAVGLFNFGFTTKQNGHGFGLHQCALTAKELGGRVTHHSDGVGQGATFTLTLPVSRNEDQKASEVIALDAPVSTA